MTFKEWLAGCHQDGPIRDLASDTKRDAKWDAVQDTFDGIMAHLESNKAYESAKLAFCEAWIRWGDAVHQNPYKAHLWLAHHHKEIARSWGVS